MSERSRADDSPRSCHTPVLVAEVLEWLDLHPGQTVVDGTVGGGGHARRILEQIRPDGILYGLDRDPEMLSRARSVLPRDVCHLQQASYADRCDELDQSGPSVDRMLLDLGLSSDQLADDSRGFSFEADGPLDLRFDPTVGRPVWEWLASVSESELEACLRSWGEERESRGIARALVDTRRKTPIRTGRELADCVAAAVARQRGGRHPATRVFQALRIVVNDELGQLERALAETVPRQLVPGGRLVVISFHSLEDRMVKRAFQEQETWTVLTTRPVRPSTREQRVNPRCRSARLRAAVRN